MIKKSIFLSFLSGLFLSLSFSSFNLWLFAWCGFIPLFVALENKSLRQSFITAYLCGIVFWSLTIYWLIHVTLLGQIILVLYLAIYFGLFGCVIYFSRFLPVYRRLFFLPASWVLLEYLRSYLFTGFPWALIGLSQYKNLPIIQIADITGAWGVCFLVVLANTALYLFLRRHSGIKILFIPILILFLSLGYGAMRLSYKPENCSDKEQLKISVVQGNIPQDLKWDKRAAAFIQSRYKELTVKAAAQRPALIIWPEASVPGLWGRDDAEFAQVFSLAGQLDTNLLVGAVSYLNQNYFNSALFINHLGSPAATYSKLHLVPFGEYIPLKNIFPFLETIAPIGDIQPGREYTLFKQPANFGVLICFEDLFPELSREFIKRGARFLVNITNDAWYKEGSAPYQHFAASVFRSVENRVYLARAANTGISGFIDPAGRILGVVRNDQGKEIFVEGYYSQSICLAAGRRTIYNRYGDFFVVFCLLLDAGVIISILINKK
ncbi:MAG: apolipoprotein N-acyltransferase [Candidatus Omnitrophica bacterium]|nr:apolipoprotein N-acyltransferase [Candidatus Omnitrophota bacterium]MBU4302847.1 apolipoprotein N-acyltransferase [Candidatus Omnitrophota bacterium]MBU4418778.1 apolipoprotein N-acyltransferase [Candidatus Omnitrophota bacterium]MBU4468722.1 apolipoprotein N-acyltransferase [Candidatus Omnitrophota bacterium]MCG2707741.1 apolipoprotein N-acyltransferase [Candidatus Omnitrophota bacterium]